MSSYKYLIEWRIGDVIFYNFYFDAHLHLQSPPANGSPMKKNTAGQVYIHITYNKQAKKCKIDNKVTPTAKESANMSRCQNINYEKHNYICSICLNNLVHNKRHPQQLCPVCTTRAVSNHHIEQKERRKDYSNGDCVNDESDRHLLNEVLSVFQSRRAVDKTCRRDASVNTEKPGVSRLSIKHLFTHSIEDKPRSAECIKSKCIILNATQPRRSESSHFAILYKKSSSIPQMKLEELKHTFKEKTKSKDVIEEVNRIFATVNKNTYANNDGNRPAVRHGPSILPIVKNKDYYKDAESKCCKECSAATAMPSGNNHVKCDKHVMGDKHATEACCDDKCTKCCNCCNKYVHGCQQMCECCRKKNFTKHCCQNKQTDVH